MSEAQNHLVGNVRRLGAHVPGAEANRQGIQSLAERRGRLFDTERDVVDRHVHASVGEAAVQDRESAEDEPCFLLQG